MSNTRSVEVGAINPGPATDTSPEIVLHGRIRRGNMTVIGQTANIITAILLAVAVIEAGGDAIVLAEITAELKALHPRVAPA